jgi:heme exporter protein D
MRVFIAGLLGGIVFFVWGAVAHMALPIGQMGMKSASNEEAVLAAIRDNGAGEGVYQIPDLSPAAMNDPAMAKAYSDKAKANPYAFVVFQPVGHDAMDMSGNLVKQFISDTLSALVVAFVLALGSFSFGKRVFIATALGLFSWLTISVPYWNWYRFPLDFTVGSLLEQVLGWMIAGIAMAWWLGRRAR